MSPETTTREGWVYQAIEVPKQNGCDGCDLWHNEVCNVDKHPEGWKCQPHTRPDKKYAIWKGIKKAPTRTKKPK